MSDQETAPADRDDLALLLEVTDLAAHGTDLSTVLARCCQLLAEAVPAHRVGLIVDEGDALRLAAGHELGRGPLPTDLRLDRARHPEVAHALETGRPVAIADVRSDPLLEPVRDLVSAAGVRSLLVVPLLARDRCVGALSLARRADEEPFTAPSRPVVQAVANQLALAVSSVTLEADSQRAQRDLERKVEERTTRLRESHLRLSVLNEITAAINVSLDVESIVAAALNSLDRLPWIEGSRVYLVTDGGVRVFHRGETGELAEHLVEARAGENLPYISLDESDGMGSPGSHLLAPLVSNDGVAGAVQVVSREGAQGEADVELIHQVAGEISIALDRTELHAAESRRSSQFEVISDIGRQLTGSVTLENLLPTAASLIRRSFGYSLVTVLTRKPDTNELIVAGVAAADPALEESARGHRQPASDGICGRAVRTGETTLVQDVHEDPDFVSAEGVDMRSELVVPILLTGETVGLLDLQSEKTRAFTANDVAVVETLADQLGAALQLARLFDDLQRQHEFTERVLNHLTSGLIVTDGNRVVQVVNLRGAGIFHLDRWDLLGKDLLEVMPTAAPLFQSSPDSIRRECELLLPDGERIPVGFSNAVIAGADGEKQFIIITFRDLSEVRALQRKVRHAERLATIGSVAAGVAHEIRNPLFGISATAQILARELQDGSPLVELCEGMLDETRRLNKLVESLVNYSRPQVVHRAPIEPGKLWENVLQQGSARAEAAGVTVVRDFPEDERTVEVDADQIKQVLLNLLLNAIDAAPEGRVELSIRWEGDGEWMTTTVRDDGEGMTAEQMERIFDLFYTTKSKGSGMGLAISSKIVEDHGGRLTAASPAGGGAEFQVRLPVSASVVQTASDGRESATRVST